MSLIERLTTFWQTLTPGTKRLMYYGCVALIILSPLIVIWGLSLVLFDTTPLEYVPLPSDEIMYWHQVATFKEAGFDGGYYTIEEIPAAISSIHFYAHGPVYPLVMGLLGRVFGWRLSSQPLFNIAFMMLALAAFIAITRPDFSRLVLLVLAFYTLWPMLTFMLTGMRVSPQVSMAIVLAALFYRLLVQGEGASIRLIVGTGAWILFMALFKSTWGLLFWPYFLLVRDRLRLSWVLATIIAGLCIVGCLVVDGRMASFVPNVVDVMGIIRHESLGAAVKVVSETVWENVKNFGNPAHKHIWLLLRGQMLLLIAVGLWDWWKGQEQIVRREGMLIALNSGMIVGVTILLYDVFDWRDYRLFLPHMMLAMFIFVARRRRMLLVILIASNMVMAPSALKTYQDRNYFSFGPEVTARVTEFAQDVGDILIYDADQENAWCNTLLIPMDVLVSQRGYILGTPPGIGLSWSRRIPTASTFRSRYVLLFDELYAQVEDRIPLVYQASTAAGDLYINQAVECR